MSALIPALIQLLLSGRGRGGGGGGGGRGGSGRSGYSRGGSGRSGYSRGGYSRGGRQPFDPQADLDKRAGQFLHGGTRNPFADSASYDRDDQAVWNDIWKQLGSETEYPEPEIPEDIYDLEEE